MRALAVAAVSGAVILGGVGAAQPEVQAAPDPVTQAKTRLAQIDEQTARVQEDYTSAQADLDKAQKDLEQAEKDLVGQTQKVETLRKALGRVALGDYQTGGGVSRTTQLVTSGDSGQFLSKLATVQNVTARTNEQFQDFQAQQARLTSLKTQAEVDRSTIKARRDRQAKLLADARNKQQEAKAVVNRLTAQQRAELARQQEMTAISTAATTSRAATPSATPSAATASATASAAKNSTVSVPSVDGPTSERARKAMAFALAQVGKAYVWGGTGPNGFDCSGLMLSAWASAGVGLPRTAHDQFGVGTPVSRSDLQPGDLVFFYPGIGHVGMYIGGGKVVHASNPATGIKISDLSRMRSYQGARRVG